MNKIIITEKQKKAIEEKVIETVNKINNHYHIDMQTPKIFYDVQGTNGGLAKYASMSVHFNIKIMLENFDDYLRSTVPHEVCHIGVWQKYLKEKKQVSPKAHGAEWKLMMFVVGAPARRTHEYDVDEIKKSISQYEYHCLCKQALIVSSIIHNKIKKGKIYECVRCHNLLTNGERIIKTGFSRESPNQTTKTRTLD